MKDLECTLKNLSENMSKYEKLIKIIVLINIIIPIIHSAISWAFPSNQSFFIAIIFFSILQILNIYEYRKGEIIYLYIFSLNFIGLILKGQISIFFALTSALRVYFT